MDDNTSKTVKTIVEGLNSEHGTFVLIAVLFVFSILCNIAVSYFFIDSSEKKAELYSKDAELKIEKIDAIHKSLEDLILKMELHDQKLDLQFHK